MNLELAKIKIDELRKELEHHSQLYYDSDAPTISDYEYDMLSRELKSLESEYPELVDSTSPTQHVGGTASKLFDKVPHAVKMESLQDAFSFEELRDFDARIREVIPNPEYVVEAKIDGLSVSLEYANGEFIMGSTRGDGLVGENVTQNLDTIKDVPKKLKSKKTDIPEFIEVRGEVYMPREEFLRVVEEQENSGKQPFKNPRNAAAGSLRQKDSAITKTRGLSIFVFNMQQITGKELSTHSESLDYMKSLGFKVSPRYSKFNSIDDVINEINTIGEMRGDFSFDIDGAVVKVNNFADRERMGSTNKYPKWAIAFKYPPEEKQSTLLNIEVSVGRTGVLTPTAEFEPISLAGTTVSRAILHNEDFIKEKDVRIGDIITVRKAGDIIPEVVCVNSHSENSIPFEMPSICPSCHEPVSRGDEAALRCINPECPAQMLRNLIHFASRTAMDIDGMGIAVVTQLVEKELIKIPSDIYYLTKDELLTLDKFKEKSATNLLNAIENSKKNNLNKLIFALGIRNIGDKAASLLAGKFKTLDALSVASVESIAEIDGFGETMAISVAEFFAKRGTKDLIEKLVSANVNTTFIGEEKTEILLDKTIVVTGTLPSLSRTEAESLIVKNGGKASGSVSKKTSYVLAGEAAGSKLTKANTLGVPVITEEEFFALINK